MAKKIKITNNEEITTNKKSVYNKQNQVNTSSKLYFKLLIILCVFLFGITVYYINETNNLEKQNKKLIKSYNEVKEENEELNKKYNEIEEKNKQLNTDIDNITGDNSIYYITNKLDFFDENIVFKIDGFGNYYYTYDCMMGKVNGNYSYWAYNEEAAISQGLKKGAC